MSHITTVCFTASHEEAIKNTIFNAMDCSLMSSRRLGQEKRWFLEFPEFILTKEFPWNCKEWDKRTISNYYKSFEITVDRINGLYSKIKSLFSSTIYSSRYDKVYPTTIHQLFSLGENVWASVDQQSVFFHQFAGLPEEYQEWSDMAKHHDHTYMMSDCGNTWRAGNAAEDRMKELRKHLDDKVCTLWYNFVLGRMRKNPQDASFGLYSKHDWNTLEEAYNLFNIVPQVQDVSGFNEPTPPVNTPCLGFPQHKYRMGWMEGDYDIEDVYSNKKQWTEEEYLLNVALTNLQNACESYIKDVMKENPKQDEYILPSKFNSLFEGKESYRIPCLWTFDYDLTNVSPGVWAITKDTDYL